MPSTEQKQLVVHVIAETSSGYNNASGIVVAPGRVLTAGHVLDGASSTPEIRLCVLEPAKWIPAKVCWDGRASGRDVAVLEFDPDKLEPASREICRSFSHRLINTGTWGSHARWGSFGLPSFAWRTPKGGSKPFPEPTGLVGSTGSANPADDLDLYADALPKDATKWMGASGSGVFIDHGLRAILVEAVLDVPNKLRALLIPSLLALPDFPEAICWSPERDWFQILARKIGSLLTRSEMRDLCERLAADLGLETREPTPVATTLIALPAFDFMLTANRVGYGLVGDGDQGQDEHAYKMAGVVEEIVEAGLAEKLGTALLSRVVLSSRAGAGDGLVKLPTMEIVLAEYYSAGLDGRPADLREIPPDDRDGGEALWSELRKECPLWPHLCVPMNPAVGYGVNPTDWAKTALAHLAQALGVPENIRRGATERLAETVSTRLQTLALTPGLPVPKRWYLLYQDHQDLAPAQALKNLLPELRIFVIGLSDDPEERRTVDQLATVMGEFLDRKRKRANRR